MKQNLKTKPKAPLSVLITKKWLAVLIALLLVIVTAGALVLGPLAAPTSWHSMSWTLKSGGNNGLNSYHMESNTGVYANSYCAHMKHLSASTTYTFQQNTSANDTFATNTMMQTMAGNQKLSEWGFRAQRYIMAYSNANNLANGRGIVRSLHRRVAPAYYSEELAPWVPAYDIYAGAKAATIGGKAVAAGAHFKPGDTCNANLAFNGTTFANTTGTNSNPVYPATVPVDSVSVGPFKIDWNSGEARWSGALAQLNYGANKTTVPKFNIAATGANASRVRFFIDGSDDPVTQIPVGTNFYVKFYETSANMLWAYTQSGAFEIPVTLTPAGGKNSYAGMQNNAIITGFVGDLLWYVPTGENHINNEMTYFKGTWNFRARFNITGTAPTARPTVEKAVTEDNGINANGNYVPSLAVSEGTDVLHRMQITGKDAAGTDLIFRSNDFDLHPNDPTVTVVSTEAQLRTALLANNKNVKLGADIQLTSGTWGSTSIAEFNYILDGNGYSIKGFNGMSRALFVQFRGVMYRLRFTGFTMTRNQTSNNGFTSNNASYWYGTLADYVYGSNTRIIDVYVQGTFTFNCSDANNNVDDTASTASSGGVFGLVNCAEFYGVRVLINKVVNNVHNVSHRDANIAAQVSRSWLTEISECEVLEGTTWNKQGDGCSGGMFGYLANSTTTQFKLTNCKVNLQYTYRYPTTAVNTDRPDLGFLLNCANSVDISRCNVYVTVSNTPDNYITHAGGIAMHGDNNVNIDRCRAEIRPVAGQTRVYIGGASGVGGIAASYVGAETTNATSYRITNCYSYINVEMVTNGTIAAGILSEQPGSEAPQRLNYVTGNRATGAIVIPAGLTNTYAAGVCFGVGSSTSTRSQIVSNISSVSITNSSANAWVGGIYVGISGSEFGYVQRNLYCGTINNAGSSPNVARIAPGPNISKNLNYYTITGTNVPGADGVTTANGMMATFSGSNVNMGSGSSGTVLTYANFFGSSYINLNLGGSGSAWSGTAPNIPSIATSQTNPIYVQKIYVTDYYLNSPTTNFYTNSVTQPVNIDNLLVWEGGVFKPLRNSSAATVTGSGANTEVTFRIANNATFTFYYKVSNFTSPVSIRNVVKIMPKKSTLTGTAPNYGFDWPSRNYPNKPDKTSYWYNNHADDYVSLKDPPGIKYKLGVEKITGVDDYPLPLPGCSFQLYYSTAYYETMNSVNYSSWTNETKTTVTNNGEALLNFSMDIKNGTYVLKETAAPVGYQGAQNLGRTWYGVFKGGEMKLYLNDPTMSDEGARLTLGTRVSEDNLTITYIPQISNDPDSDIPLARIYVTKWNENGTEELFGYMEDVNYGIDEETGEEIILPVWRGATYSVSKFAEDNFTSEMNGYGRMITPGETDGVYGWNFINIRNYGYYCIQETTPPVDYMIDPTLYYFRVYNDGGLNKIEFIDNHDPNIDQIGYMPGKQTMQASPVFGAEIVDDGGTPKAIPYLYLNAYDKKPEYRLTLEKYDNSFNNKPLLDGVQFKVTNNADGQQITGSPFSTDASGRLTIDFPAGNGTYTISELNWSGGEYCPIPDYTVKCEGRRMFISGGPHEYDNIMVIRGDFDNYCYVAVDMGIYGEYYIIQDTDDYPVDFFELEEPQIGLIHTSFRVPNERPGSIKISKTVENTTRNDIFTFTVKKGGSPVDLTSGIISLSKDGVSGTYTPTDLANGKFTMTRDTTVMVNGLYPGNDYTVEESGLDTNADSNNDYVPRFVVSPGGLVTAGTMTGNLNAVPDVETTVDFINYRPTIDNPPEEGVLNIPINKTITRTDSTDKEFIFDLVQVADDSGTPMPDGSEQIILSSAPLMLTGTTGSTVITMPNDMAVGTYYLKVTERIDEEDHAWNYDMREYIATVVVAVKAGTDPLQLEITQKTYKLLGGATVGTIAFENEFLGMDFAFTKTDINGISLGEGVEFELYACTQASAPAHTHSEIATNDAGCCWDVNNPVQTVVSDEDGLVSFVALLSGDYMLVEAKTLDGYQLPMGQWLLQIVAESKTVTITGKGENKPPAFKMETGGDGEPVYSLPNFPILILPASGSMTGLMFGGLGLLSVGTGLIYWIFGRRKKIFTG